jgi:hypothetical protein
MNNFGKNVIIGVSLALAFSGCAKRTTVNEQSLSEPKTQQQDLCLENLESDLDKFLSTQSDSIAVVAAQHNEPPDQTRLILKAIMFIKVQENCLKDPNYKFGDSPNRDTTTKNGQVFPSPEGP